MSTDTPSMPEAIPETKPDSAPSSSSEASSPEVRRLGRPRHEEKDGGEVRDRLLDAAIEMAVEQGFEACGLRQIAARAEVSSGMISYYFGDREGLYEAMIRRAFDRVIKKVRALMSDPERTGTDRLDDLIRIQVASIAEDPWLPKLLMREVLLPGTSPTTEYFVKSMGSGPLALLIEWLEEEQAKGELRDDFDPRMMAFSIISLSVFPFLSVPLVGSEIGLKVDDEFADRLIEHNQKLLALGLRAQSEGK